MRLMAGGMAEWLRRAGLVLVLVLMGMASGAARAQAVAEAVDVGLVSQVAGAVTYSGSGSGNQPVRAFMRIRQGDRITLPAGSSLRLIYTSSGRQETWQGPASLRAGPISSENLGGKPPVVQALPASVPQRMARVPDLVTGARLGGIVVRGSGAGRPAKPSPEVEKARALYQTMRAEASADDVTPELFLIAVLQENGLVDELQSVTQEMLKRQPGTPEVKELATWARQRAEAPR